jgi:hypothetical protein
VIKKNLREGSVRPYRGNASWEEHIRQQEKTATAKRMIGRDSRARDEATTVTKRQE